MHIFNVPLPIIFNVLEYLSVEEVWELRTVCKLFYNICANYFKEKLRELFLNETWLYSKVFGRTIKILQNCTNLKLLTIELQHSISAGKILALFNDLQKAGCKLFECSLQGFSIPDYYFPNITENLLTVRKLCLVDLVCSDWRDLFVCLLQPRTQYTALQFLSLQLPRYDGVDLLYLGRNCPNVMFLNVSYCSQLRGEYLESALRGWPQLVSVHCVYVPCVKNSTVRVLMEYCPSLLELRVRGTQVTLNTLMPLLKRNVTVDILQDSEFTVPPKLPLQS